METSLAIYEALLQANVPAPAARRVAEALEKDMTSTLVTKQDLLATKQDLQHEVQMIHGRIDALEERMSLRFQGLESTFDLKLSAMGAKFESLESRLLLKLAGLIVVLVGTLNGLLTLFVR